MKCVHMGSKSKVIEGQSAKRFTVNFQFCLKLLKNSFRLTKNFVDLKIVEVKKFEGEIRINS